jgi:hypothetical protein
VRRLIAAFFGVRRFIVAFFSLECGDSSPLSFLGSAATDRRFLFFGVPRSVGDLEREKESGDKSPHSKGLLLLPATSGKVFYHK